MDLVSLLCSSERQGEEEGRGQGEVRQKRKKDQVPEQEVARSQENVMVTIISWMKGAQKAAEARKAEVDRRVRVDLRVRPDRAERKC